MNKEKIVKEKKKKGEEIIKAGTVDKDKDIISSFIIHCGSANFTLPGGNKMKGEGVREEKIKRKRERKIDKERKKERKLPTPSSHITNSL